MRHASYDVVMALTTDVVLISLVGIGNVARVYLALIIMDTPAINRAIMTFTLFMLY